MPYRAQQGSDSVFDEAFLLAVLLLIITTSPQKNPALGWTSKLIRSYYVVSLRTPKSPKRPTRIPK